MFGMSELMLDEDFVQHAQLEAIEQETPSALRSHPIALRMSSPLGCSCSIVPPARATLSPERW